MTPAVRRQGQVKALCQRLDGESSYMGMYITTFKAEDTVKKVPVVVTFDKPYMRFIPEPEYDTAETASDEEVTSPDEPNPKSLEYRITGLTWFTKDYVGTCNLDSFLSAWIRKARQTHGKNLQKVTCMDAAGVALLKIADHALTKKSRMRASYIKGLWLEMAMKASGETRRFNKKPIWCGGWSSFSIFQHLTNHCSFELTSQCQCGTVYHRDYMFKVHDLNQVRCLAKPEDIGRTRLPMCSRCKKLRKLENIELSEHVWLLAFDYEGFGKNRSPDLMDIPHIVEMDGKRFKLEYLTYEQSFRTSNHEMSIHLIKGNWYKYDDGISPKFIQYKEKNFTRGKARLVKIIYFRI